MYDARPVADDSEEAPVESPPEGDAEAAVPDVDALIERLRANVAERRAKGHYPPGLEAELDDHFRRIVAHRADAPFDMTLLRKHLAGVASTSHFGRHRIAMSTDIPGGDRLHRAVGKVVSRQVDGILQQVQEFATEVRGLLEALVAVVEDPGNHQHPGLVSQIDAVLDRLAAYERSPLDSEVAVRDLRARTEALEDAERRRQFQPTYGNERFEDKFRGPRDDVIERYRDLASLFRDCAPVVDIGCGRAEFLELLGQVPVEAWGVEIDPALVKAGLDAGLDVRLGDALSELAGASDDSLGGIALMQVIEHLTAQEVVDLVALAAAKVRRGGKVIIETVNPQSLYVYAHAFYLDPTHGTPVHPAYLKFLFEEHGFHEVELRWRSPVPDGDLLEVPPGASDVEADNARRINELVFAPQDYAVIATR